MSSTGINNLNNIFLDLDMTTSIPPSELTQNELFFMENTPVSFGIVKSDPISKIHSRKQSFANVSN